MFRVILGLSLALLLGLNASIQPSSAQEGTYDLPIQVANCPEAPSDAVGQGFTAECEPSIGSTFTVTDANTGEVYGSCEAAAFEVLYAQCTVTVTVGATVIVTETAAPAGYVPFEVSVTREISAAAIQAGEGAYAPFFNVPQTTPPSGEEPPPSDAGAPSTQLPNTGAGSSLKHLVSFFR